MDGATEKAPPTEEDVKAQNKELSVQFKAQHALVIGWFTLILYVMHRAPGEAAS